VQHVVAPVGVVGTEASAAWAPARPRAQTAEQEEWADHRHQHKHRHPQQQQHQQLRLVRRADMASSAFIGRIEALCGPQAAAARATHPLPAGHPLQRGFFGAVEAAIVDWAGDDAATSQGDGFEVMRLTARPCSAASSVASASSSSGGVCWGGRRACARTENEVLICHSGEWLVRWWKAAKLRGVRRLRGGDALSIAPGMFCEITVFCAAITGHAQDQARPAELLSCVAAAAVDEPREVQWRDRECMACWV
jgi:hypothetical protein